MADFQISIHNFGYTISTNFGDTFGWANLKFFSVKTFTPASWHKVEADKLIPKKYLCSSTLLQLFDDHVFEFRFTEQFGQFFSISNEIWSYKIFCLYLMLLFMLSWQSFLKYVLCCGVFFLVFICVCCINQFYYWYLFCTNW